ncbi:MAG: type VI secretion system baseplate subunit TssF [Flavobacteriaceae bacterium]|nr:type VI secretion system baseplate subunit TssF [Flavobacteriaceae bacterium]
MKENTKEQIKNRMLKKAAALWDVAVNEIDMSFDPVVTLLIAACASEIEKISSEINESQTRVTEKLIQLMTPETVYGTKPAHAILYAEPDEKKVLLKPEYLFYHKKKKSYKNTSVKYTNIYFSPVQDFNLIAAKIKFFATENQILEVEGKKNIQNISQNANLNLPPSTLYLGLVPDDSEISLNNISFYFELQDIEDKTIFYHHLKNTKWSINGKEIDVTEGFYNTADYQKVNLDIIFNDTSSKTNNICLQANKIYVKHYVTVKLKSKQIKKSNFNELDIAIKKSNAEIDNDVIWIKIEFPRIISNATLKNVFCSLNAFPVLNRELKNFTYEMREFIDIIPIKTEDSFLDMKSIMNTKGTVYNSTIKNNSNIEKGTYLLRSANVGKLEHRKAKEYIVHLIELLKDESAAFSLFNNDFLQLNLKGLNQLISLLEKKAQEISNETTETNYIFLKPFKKKENILIEYWTTNGKLANNIKSGSSLEVFQGIGIKQRSSLLISPSFGGESELSMKDRLNAYRRLLLSRERIVTKEDIKALCYELYNEKIEKVEITRGYVTDIALNKGVIQCVEILLYPNTREKTENREWEALNSNLLLILEKDSLNVFPYRIKLAKL